MLSKVDKEIMSTCMLDFKIPADIDGVNFIGVLIERLLEFEGVGTEMSDISLGCDSDPLSIPNYLDSDGFDMSFEYNGEHVICSMEVGAKFIAEWCYRNVVVERQSTLKACNKLVSLYGGISGLTRSEISGECLLAIFLSLDTCGNSKILQLLDCLVKGGGMGVGIAGVYVKEGEVFGCDRGMVFEFMGERITCSILVGASYIRNWCKNNIHSVDGASDKVAIITACDKLVELCDGSYRAGRVL